MSEYLLIQDDKKFGIPEQKKFPMPDADHVRSAIKFFNYVEPKYEKQLAKAILRRAKEFGVDISEMNIGDNNRFKKYLPNDELMHRGTGWSKKNHKYIDRFWKNGKWFYVYKNGKKYNRLQDWFGVDEHDAFIDSVKRWSDYNRDFINNKSLSKEDYTRRTNASKELNKISTKKRNAYEKTLHSKVYAIKDKYDDVKYDAQQFIKDKINDLKSSSYHVLGVEVPTYKLFTKSQKSKKKKVKREVLDKLVNKG